MLAPVAYQKLMHADGELEMVRGAAAAEAAVVLSSFSTVSSRTWPGRRRPALVPALHPAGREFTRGLVGRAEAAGYAPWS